MRDISSALSGTMAESRDPDGIEADKLDEVRLEPAGSHSEAIIRQADSLFSNITNDTGADAPTYQKPNFDVAKLVGVPPPPPKHPPPRKKKRTKGGEKIQPTAIEPIPEVNDEDVSDDGEIVPEVNDENEFENTEMVSEVNDQIVSDDTEIVQEVIDESASDDRESVEETVDETESDDVETIAKATEMDCTDISDNDDLVVSEVNDESFSDNISRTLDVDDASTVDTSRSVPVSPHEPLLDNDMVSYFSLMTKDSHTIDVDEYSLASRSIASRSITSRAALEIVESQKPETICHQEMLPSSSEVTKAHSNHTDKSIEPSAETEAKSPEETLINELGSSKVEEKSKNRGFFKNLFKRGKKSSHMDPITESISHESKNSQDSSNQEKAQSSEPFAEDLLEPAVETKPVAPEDSIQNTDEQVETTLEEQNITVTILIDTNETSELQEESVKDQLSPQEDVVVVAVQDFPDTTGVFDTPLDADTLLDAPELYVDEPLSQNTAVMVTKNFSQDPPDNEHGDPPRSSGPPLISPTSANPLRVTVSEEENENIRVETVRSRIAELYEEHNSPELIKAIPGSLSVDISLFGGDVSTGSSLHQRCISIDPEADGDIIRLPSTRAQDAPESILEYEEGKEPIQSNMSQLRVLVSTPSADPAGASPTLKDSTRGRPEHFESAFQDPVGESPVAWKKSINDPVGESPCHTEDLKKSKESFDEPTESLRLRSQDPPLEVEVMPILERKNDKILPSKEEGPTTIEEALPEEIENKKSEANRAASDLVKPGVAGVAKTLEVEPTTADAKTPAASKKLLSVSTAAFSNAKTIAYLHQLHGERSPRHSWHVSRRKMSKEIPQTKPKKTPKDVLKQKLREKYSAKQESVAQQNRKKVPSPDDYSADNLEIIASIEEQPPTPEELLENKDISKFQGFGQNSKFKGRNPLKKKRTDETQSEDEEIASKDNNEVTTTSSDLSLIFSTIAPAEKMRSLAVERGLKMRREKEENPMKSKPHNVGRNRFHFRVPESEIKDPIQRASRRLLSKAALRIQAAARMYLAKRETLDRMWAILLIQSYCRRWNCEARLKTHIQRKRNRAAIQIQKTVRGYLALAEVYDIMFCIVSIQAVMRGSHVRMIQTRRKEELIANADFAVPIQAMFRTYQVRKELARDNLAACKIQSLWLSHTAKIDFRCQLVDIMVTQSVVRRWIACRNAKIIRNAPYAPQVTKIQARLRGYAARSLHKKMMAAQKIQTAWRAFHAYTDYVFALVDILVVQRTARQWLAVRNVNALRQKKLEKKTKAAVAIQKTWRGFWSFSQYIIVQYEITRLQAIVRGKIARQNYHMKFGCAIIIQASIRQYQSKKLIGAKMISDALKASSVEELRERNAAKKIQFWWRIVLEWTKEKRAALVIERFFVNVKKEVEREVRRQERKASMKRRNKKRESAGFYNPLQMILYSGGAKTEDSSTRRRQRSQRSQSAPRHRRREPQPHRTPVIGSDRRAPSHSQVEIDNWPIPDISMANSTATDISGITTPDCLVPLSNSVERYSREKRSANDYIKKYNRVDTFNQEHKARTSHRAPESKPRHFFDEERKAAVPPRTPVAGGGDNQASFGAPRSSGTPRRLGMPSPRGVPSPQRRAPSPRREYGASSPRRAPSPRREYGAPLPRRAPSPRKEYGGPSPRRTPSPRKEYGGPSSRRTPSPRKEYGVSPRRENDSYYSPVALKRQHGVIKRDNTAETDSMSRSTASGHFRSSSNERLSGVHRSPVVVKNNKFSNFSPRNPANDGRNVVYLGPDYGEV
jgi:hypothetical protein